MLIIGPVKAWYMFVSSPRAKNFVKLMMEMCLDILVYFIIAGVVIALEIMSIIEGSELLNTMQERKNVSFTV